MFKRLYVRNGIKHDGVTFNFEKGITAITGPNGCGKSLLAEFMAFALFGTKALRLPADKYEGLYVEADIVIRGKKYGITRGTKTCVIVDDGDMVVCNGTKACNLKLVELLGYGYPVYKMGNYAAQFEITNFGKLPPSERKKAVDQVLGLTILDTLIKYTNDEGNKHLSEVKGMESVLVKPIEPEKPEGVDQEESLVQQSNAIKAIIDRKALVKQLKENLGNLPTPTKPIKPEGMGELTSEEIKNILSKKKLLEFQCNQYAGMTAPSYTIEQLDEMEKVWPAYSAYQNYLTQMVMVPKVKPEISLQEALDGIAEWDKYNNYMKIKQEIITCPNCSTKFNRSGDLYSENEPQRPKIIEKYYKEQAELNHLWERITIPEEVPEVAKPQLFQPEISRQRTLIEEWDKREKELPVILEEILKYDNITDGLFSMVQAYEYALATYEQRVKQWEEYIHKSNEYIAELQQLESLGDVEGMYKTLSDKLNLIQVYKTHLAVYENSLKEYNERHEYLETIKDKGDRYKQASEKLKEIKAKMKQYILPSLARLASRLLSEMSEGQYSSIEIDDNFNITLNGLEIVGYSGSEQAMANIAIRIALGQVLTHKSFDVFIGDEIDDSMRPERAQATADCLRKLSQHIGQIILISHRNIEADNYINLGEH